MKIITSLLKDLYYVDAVNLTPALHRQPHQIGVKPSELLASLYVYAPRTISVRVRHLAMFLAPLRDALHRLRYKYVRVALPQLYSATRRTSRSKER